jgi:hypothetical protein
MIRFDDTLSIGHLNDDELAAYLDQIDDPDAAKTLRDRGVRGQGLARMLGKAYAHTAHVYGFIAEGDPTTDRVPIVPAASIKADKTLVTNSIKVTLDAFRIQEYPGLGLHTVLFDFIGRDQAGDESQDLRFASVFKSNDKDNAALNGAPVFTGLTVPPDGLSFQARTITIRSAGDETILNVLQSAAFKDGLKLLGHVQPALPQLVGLAGGITENLLKRRWNRQVQCFDLGLDFSRSLTSTRLRRGSYVVVQVPDVSLWKWTNWSFDPGTLNIVDASGVVAPYNTIIFAVTNSDASNAQSAIRDEGRNMLAASQSP